MQKAQTPDRGDRDRDADRRTDVEPVEIGSPDPAGRDRSMDPEEMTLEDFDDAEASRPDLPDETADGLNDLDEEVRRQAEDRTVVDGGRD